MFILFQNFFQPYFLLGSMYCLSLKFHHAHLFGTLEKKACNKSASLEIMLTHCDEGT